MEFLVEPDELIRLTFATVLKPPPPADLVSWAEANIIFGNESPFPGPFRRSTFPPIVRILEVLSPDHPARVVSVMGSAQFGKTTVAQIFVAGCMDIDPCNMLYVHPSHDNAIRWARSKWQPMRRQSAALRRIFGETKTRDSADTTLYQEHRLGLGSLQISGANSPASLSMISTPRIVEDDLAKWESNPAGDPEKQADNRAAAFEWAKILKISTPLYAKTCRMTRAWKAGTQERWHVPCPHCAHEQPLTWENFLANLDHEKPEAACFSCVSCGGVIEHRHKIEIVAGGRWVPENPGARDPSFHLWRAYVPNRDWESIAREWIAAEGDPYAEQTFFNDVLGLPYERASEAPPWEGLRDRAHADGHDRGVVPEGGLILAAGADCQGDRVEVHVQAFGAQLKRWTVDYHVIPHHISAPEAWEELDRVLKKLFPAARGRRRTIDMLAIDANAYTKDVFAWAKRHPWTKVICVRGAKSEQAVPLALTKSERKADGTVRKAQKRFYNVGVSGLKAALYEQLRKHDPLARGYVGLPKGLSDEFFRQLCAEQRVVEKDRWGYPQARWQMVHERNEVLDTTVYAEAAAIRCGWYTRLPEDWSRLADELEQAVKGGDAQDDLFDPGRPQLSSQAHAKPPAETPARAGFINRDTGSWLNR
ncbi:MAG: terminase gpA endonuclease subunit [Armatimonadia bacterium]